MVLVAVTCEVDVLFSAIKADAHSLRHLFFNTMSIMNALIGQLAKLLALTLGTMQVVDVITIADQRSAIDIAERTQGMDITGPTSLVDTHGLKLVLALHCMYPLTDPGLAAKPEQGIGHSEQPL